MVLLIIRRITNRHSGIVLSDIDAIVSDDVKKCSCSPFLRASMESMASAFWEDKTEIPEVHASA